MIHNLRLFLPTDSLRVHNFSKNDDPSAVPNMNPAINHKPNPYAY